MWDYGNAGDGRETLELGPEIFDCLKKTRVVSAVIINNS
jgi:hypothetical protein